MDWRRLPTEAWLRGLHVMHRLTRPMTLGVRGLVLDANGRVFLVRHSYVAGWHLPGGGVEPGETAIESLRRELQEEGNIEVDETPALLGVFFNARHSRRDHVLVYVVRAFRQSRPPGKNWEIVETGFFPIDDAPAGTTGATLARLAELAGTQPMSERW
jgi:8-oxo-dGTP pyrophosphatase MutT (NUDIX family)